MYVHEYKKSVSESHPRGIAPHMRAYTSFKIGGLAVNFITVQSKEQLSHFQIRGKKNQDFLLLGGGSNILVKDGTLYKPILKLGKQFEFIVKITDDYFKVGAAVKLSDLLKYMIREQLGGVEAFAGIPACIGGMCVINASAFGVQFSDLIEEIEIIDHQGKCRIVKKNELQFGYRTSSLTSSVITSVVLRLKQEKLIRQKISYFLKKRIATQDFRFPSAGCVFKNPSQYSAGMLIEQSNCKNLRKGGAVVSPRHANFIINQFQATAADVRELIELVKIKVFDEFRIALSEEIQYWND